MDSNEKKVLFIGPDGSGKTTLINSLFNYVKNETYSEKPDISIGMSLQYTNPTTKSTINVLVGPVKDYYNSSCQILRSETLSFDANSYVLIDTPGLTQHYDEKEKKEIRNDLYSQKHISTICFVFESSDSEQKVNNFCDDFLSSFPELKYDNIIFCVTKTREYQTPAAFEHVFKSIPSELQNKLNKDSLFCFNNDGFIHAMISSVQEDIIYKKDLEMGNIRAKRYWESSAQTAKALLNAIRHSVLFSTYATRNNILLDSTQQDTNLRKNDELRTDAPDKIIENCNQENKNSKTLKQVRKENVEKLKKLKENLEENIREKNKKIEKLECKEKETEEILEALEKDNISIKLLYAKEIKIAARLRQEQEKCNQRYEKLNEESMTEKTRFHNEKKQWSEEKQTLRQEFEMQLKTMEKLLKASEDQRKEDKKNMQSENDGLSKSLRDLKMDLSNKSADFERILSEKKRIIQKHEDENQHLKAFAQNQMDIASLLNKSNDDINLLNSETSNQPIEKSLVKHIESKFSKDEKIILLLGETGVGKSTFINSALNYISHPDIDEAMTHEAKILIPTHVDVYDEQYTRTNTKLFKHNIDSHVVYGEKVSKGQSLTQKARYYRINDGQHKYVLIDTAGIGDIRGEDKDKECLNELKKFLRDEGITHIHAVCILMHPNYKRFTDSMIYVLNSTVDFFGSNADNNIFFCFTRTASTSFNPGVTLSTLRNYLKERATKTGKHPKTDRSNVFCFDNSCFREKLVYEMNNVCEPDQRTVEAWNKSVNSMNRLFNAIYCQEKPFEIPEIWFT